MSRVPDSRSGGERGGDRRYSDSRESRGDDRHRAPADSRYRPYDARESRGGYERPGRPTYGRPPVGADRRFRVSLSGLPEHFTWRELKDLLRASGGNVNFANVTRPGLGIGEFASDSEQMAAIRNLDGKEVEGCVVRCRIAQDEEGVTGNSGSFERGAGGGDRGGGTGHGGGYAVRGYERDGAGRSGGYDSRSSGYDPRASGYDSRAAPYADSTGGRGYYGGSGGSSYAAAGAERTTYDERGRYSGIGGAEGGSRMSSYSTAAGYGNVAAGYPVDAGGRGSYSTSAGAAGYGSATGYEDYYASRGGERGRPTDPGYAGGYSDARRDTAAYDRGADRAGYDSRSAGYASTAGYESRGYPAAAVGSSRGSDPYYSRDGGAAAPISGRGGPDRSYGSRGGREY